MVKFFRTYRQLTLPLVVCLLIAATGFTIDKHSCQGEFKGLSIFGQAASCHQIGTSCHFQSEETPSCSNDLPPKDCCHNEATFVKLDNDLVEPLLESFHVPTVDIGLLHVFLGLIYSPSIESSFKYENYKPPLLSKNILVFVQSFLL